MVANSQVTAIVNIAQNKNSTIVVQVTPGAISGNQTLYQSQLNSKLASLEQIIGADRLGGAYNSSYHSNSPDEVSKYDNITYRASTSSPYGGSKYAKKYWSGPGYLNVSISANAVSASTNTAPISDGSNNNNAYANSGSAPPASASTAPPASASTAPPASASTAPPPSSYQNSANYASPTPVSNPSNSPYANNPYASAYPSAYPSANPYASSYNGYPPYSNPSSPYRP